MQWVTITLYPLIHSKNVVKSSFSLCSVLLLFTPNFFFILLMFALLSLTCIVTLAHFNFKC